MDNYIIDSNCVALQKDKNKTIIYNVNNIKVINKNINKIIEYNCLIYGSDIIGRKEFVKNNYNIKYKIPIIINNNIILLQLNSLRYDKCLFIILNKIDDYNYKNHMLKIKCLNNTFYNSISKNSFEKMILNGIKINNYLNNHKKVNFV